MSSTEIVSIVIFFLYIFLCIIGFTIIFLMGRAYLDLSRGLHHYFENQQPFYQCSDQQQRILILMQSLQTDPNADLVKQVTTLTKDEFIHQINENKKNNAINYISLGIGIAGILVSVLLTVLQLAA